VLGKFYNVVDTIGGLGAKITSKAAGMWDGIGIAFKGVINAMIGWWNNLEFSINIPDNIPGLPDSFTISTPNIPLLGSGGIVNRATLAVIGEDGPEAVVPLDRLRGGGGDVHIHLDGTFVGGSRAQVGAWLADALSAYYGGGGRRA
jgi:hypothetical protein